MFFWFKVQKGKTPTGLSQKVRAILPALFGFDLKGHAFACIECAICAHYAHFIPKKEWFWPEVQCWQLGATGR